MKKRVPDTTCSAVEGRYTQLVFLVLFFLFLLRRMVWLDEFEHSFFENSTSWAGLLGSGLKSILEIKSRD